MEHHSIPVPWQVLQVRIGKLFGNKTAPNSIHIGPACIHETAANYGAKHRCILRVLDKYSNTAE
jgi:hypothetical protein